MQRISESAESLFGELHKPFFNSIDPELTSTGSKFRSAASPDLMLANPLYCRSG
jgi:hypothetical protein